MMAKQIIVIDVDDVIADSTETLRQMVNQWAGASLTKDHYRVPGEYWGYYERIWHAHDIADKISYESLESNMVEDQSHVPVLAGASLALTELAESYSLVLLTARDPSWEGATRKWFKQCLPHLPLEMYFTRKVSRGEQRSKGEICAELGATYLIDDNPDNCISAEDHGVEAVLFGEYGWHHNAPDNIDRCKDWPAVLDYFNGKS